MDDQARGTDGGDAVGPGDVLSDRYVLGERIGRGGMAEVYRARDRRLGRDVAVKVLAPHLLQEPGAARQLQREARSAASIRHPGVVAVHDAGSDGDTHYLVMELVEGPTLSEVLAAEGPLPPDRAAAMAAAIADAVQAAHERGVVHRDLKPSNVLFDADGAVRVTDFGIAHAAGGTTTATATALIAGSVPYLAPEQARGEDPSPAADLYALGCLLFESLTGRRPFTGATSAALIAAHLHADPPRPSEVRPDLPPWLDDAVVRALAKDPAERQPDAAALAAELRRGLQGVTGTVADATTVPMIGLAGTETVTLPPADPDTPPRRPLPWRWAAGGAVAALLVAGAIAGLTRIGDPSSAEPNADASPTEPAAAAPSASPTAAPSPAPTSEPEAQPTDPDPAPTDPAAAATQVREHLDEARRTFRIAEDDAEDLDDRLAEVVDKHREGKRDDARKKLDELRRKVEDLAEKGRIDRSLQEDLRDALDDLDATL